jgi:hypothetical protein
VIMTPFGVPVEPEVYCKNASDSPLSDGSSHWPASPSSIWSVASHWTGASSGASEARRENSASNEAVVSATFA